MVKRNGFVLLALAGMVLASAGVAQDWPQWRGPNRDGKIEGFVSPATWPAALTQQWRTVVGAGDSGPVLVGDRVYVHTREGDQEVTRCLNAADGTEVWKDAVAMGAVSGPAARQHSGPRSTPVVADGMVVTVGAIGVVSCLDAATGKLLWRKDPFPGVTPRFFAAASPLVVAGAAVVYLGGAGNGAIIAYDLATGEEKGRWAEEGPDYASPVLMTVADTPQLVTLTEKSLVGVGLEGGQLLWRLPWVPQGRAYNASTPIVSGDTVYYSGSQRGTAAAKIEKQGETFTATQTWCNPEVACQFSTPVLRDGFLYGVSDKGNLFCLNAQTGQAAWVDPATTDRGSYGAMMDAGEVLMCMPSGGELIVFKPDSTAFTQVARLKLADTPVYAHPAVSGKRIIVKDQDAVTMWGFGE